MYQRRKSTYCRSTFLSLYPCTRALQAHIAHSEQCMLPFPYINASFLYIHTQSKYTYAYAHTLSWSKVHANTSFLYIHTQSKHTYTYNVCILSGGQVPTKVRQVYVLPLLRRSLCQPLYQKAGRFRNLGIMYVRLWWGSCIHVHVCTCQC
jgi:hypothetical protein